MFRSRAILAEIGTIRAMIEGDVNDLKQNISSLNDMIPEETMNRRMVEEIKSALKELVAEK